MIITQDEPFFLAGNIEYLLSNLPKDFSVVACVLSAPSPFGKRESFFAKAKKTFKIFGARFFLWYGVQFLRVKIFRGLRVNGVLRAYGIPVLEFSESINSEASLNKIRSFSPDVLVSIAGNEIFKQPLIELAPHGCLNLHTALLPKYRGLMPSFWVLRYGEEETGVSVFLVDEGIDSGPIICQERVLIQKMSQIELIRTTKLVGMKCIIKALQSLKCGDVELIPNDDAEKSYFGFPTRSDVLAFKRAGARFF